MKDLQLPAEEAGQEDEHYEQDPEDRKSTRLNSSHITISYAVFCLKNNKQLHFLAMMNALMIHEHGIVEKFFVAKNNEGIQCHAIDMKRFANAYEWKF